MQTEIVSKLPSSIAIIVQIANCATQRFRTNFDFSRVGLQRGVHGRKGRAERIFLTQNCPSVCEDVKHAAVGAEVELLRPFRRALGLQGGLPLGRQLLPSPLLRGGGEARGIREVLRYLRATGSRQAVQRPRLFSSQAGRFESFFMLY